MQRTRRRIPMRTQSAGLGAVTRCGPINRGLGCGCGAGLGDAGAQERAEIVVKAGESFLGGISKGLVIATCLVLLFGHVRARVVN